MTTQTRTQRETVDLLERILERVESIDTNVEGLRDQLDDGLGGVTYSDEYSGRVDDNGYR